jgi:SAM-dependent methyltransferase
VDGVSFIGLQRQQWSRPPVDSIGYVPVNDLLAMTDEQLRRTAAEASKARYGSWRNVGNLWVDLLGLATTSGKDVLDYGCGFGAEALIYAQAGNRVTVADIVDGNVQVASRLFTAHGYTAGTALISDRPPLTGLPARSFDVIHCSGVLHHIPWARQTVEHFAELLRPRAEVRLMLYSDHGWRLATSTEPPDDVATHPLFDDFVHYFDAVGVYSDWYDRDRLETRFGDLFTVERFAYLTANRRYCAAVLRLKEF